MSKKQVSKKSDAHKAVSKKKEPRQLSSKNNSSKKSSTNKSSTNKTSTNKSSTNKTSTKDSSSKNVSSKNSKESINEPKSFNKTKKHFFKKPLFWTLVFSFLLILLILYLVVVQSKFLLDNEMHISLSPLDPVINSLNNESPEVTFVVDVMNPFFCTAECNFTLIDLSSQEELLSDYRYDMLHDKRVYNLSINEVGFGQKMFSYSVVCNNIKKGLCSTSEATFIKTATITVNFKQTVQEQSYQNQTQESLEYFFNELNFLINKSELSTASYSALLTFVNNESLAIKQFKQDLISLNVSINYLLNLNNQLLSHWENQEFQEVTVLLNQNNDFILLTKDRSELLYSAIDFYVTSLITAENYFRRVLTSELELQKLYYIYDSLNQSTKASSLLDYKHEFFSLFNEYSSKNISYLYGFSQELNSSIIKYGGFLSDLNQSLYFAKNNMTSQEDFYQSMIAELNIVSPLISLPIGLDDLDQSCHNLNSQKSAVSQHNTLAVNNRATLYPLLVLSPQLTSALEDYYLFLTSTLNQDILTPAFILDSAYWSVPTDYPVLIDGVLVNTYNLSTIPLNHLRQMTTIPWSSFSENLLLTYCDFPDFQTNLTPMSFNITPENIPSFSVEELEFVAGNFSLPIVREKCCIFGNCTPCCIGDECDTLYPIIFVHGHAFYEGTSPELAFIRLSYLQEALVDYGYINAGQISKGSKWETFPSGEWGKMPYPITTRVTYYYSAFRTNESLELVSKKSENLETYALRLKEMVEMVKDRTGKDKVIIIAHSMGGLVSRSYIDIFGEESVYKLITLGTPNNGIEGDVDRFCKLTGGRKECEDMSSSSVFISRLNDPENYLTKTKTYTIAAHGCDLKSNDGKEEGDGVVLARSVHLPFADNRDIYGECTDFFGTDLHTKFVEPLLYPEVLDLVLEFLND
jgi:predicted alpha/beta hydrolase family esterase